MDFTTRSRLRHVLQAHALGEPVERVAVDGQTFLRTRSGDGETLTATEPGDDDAIAAWWQARSALVAETRHLQANPPAPLTPDEIAALQEHDIAVFEGRFVIDAQPPIPDAQLAHVAARLAGPLPADLVALWRTCFGGRLLYDLEARIDGVEAPVPFAFMELFYPSSDHYQTLDGWMDHELDLARRVAGERGEPLPDTLAYLPIGGFEYLERIYVRVDAEDHGGVVGWRKALPPAWNDPVGHDAVAHLADDVRALFRALHVDVARVGDDLGSAMEFLTEVVEPLREAAGDALADRVRAHFLGAKRS